MKGPYFLRHYLNSADCLHFVNTELNKFLDNMPLQYRNVVKYECDGAPRAVKHRFLEIFSGNMLHFWSPRPHDTNLLDSLLRGYLKGKGYKHRPLRDISLLEAVFGDRVLSMRPSVIRKSVTDASRTIICIEHGGRHTEI